MEGLVVREDEFTQFVSNVRYKATMARETKNLLVNEIFERKLAAIAGQWATGRLLDIGCGTKPYASMFSPHVKEHVGVDRAEGPHGVAGVDVFGTAYEIPVSDASFDTVLCTFEHGLVAAVETELDNDPAFTNALQQTVNDIAANYWTAATPTQISGTLRAWLRDWIEELLCDHLAIEVAGPSFMWAFTLFVLPLSYGEPGSEHPPNTVRMRLAIDHLARRGWRPHMERVAPGITAWLDQIAGDATGPLDRPFAFLRDQLIAHANVLQDTAMARSSGDALDPRASEPAADEASDLLRRLILPVGLAEPLEPRAIVLGGWQQAFQEHGDDPAGLVTALTDQRLQELVGKAIEMSVVSAAWQPAA